MTTEEITPEGMLLTRKVPHLLCSQREQMALRSALAYLNDGKDVTSLRKNQSGSHAATCVLKQTIFKLYISEHAPAKYDSLTSEFSVPIKHPLAQATEVRSATLGRDAVAS